MELLSKLLVWMRLYAQGLIDGQDFEKERQSILIALSDVCRKQSLIVLDEVEECPLCFEVFRGQRRMCSHP